MNRLIASTALATIFLAAASPVASAQILTGKVTDVSGTAPLEGAIVAVEGANRSASTNRFGEYRISNIPEGDYKVTVSYIGTKPVSSDVSVPAAGTSLNFTLGGDVRYLDNILVVGSSAAQAGALNQQRASNSILSVIDSDGLGNFPDTTVADSLARVPGLSIETDQGEGRYVSIRGINTDLISASINGVRAPSPEDRRGVLLDGVPSDLLDGIEVQKSLTPDVDADSLGGVINLKTISAFDRDERFIRAKIEGQYNETTEEISPKATLTYSEAFNDKFGVALSLNYQKLAIQTHNNETGEAAIDEDTGFSYLNDDYEQRYYDLTRERLGFVANFDWRVSENTDLYLRTLFNNYVDDEVRNKFELKDLDDVEDDGTISKDGFALPLNEIDAEVRVREEKRQIQTIALGGNTQFDTFEFDYEVSYAYAEEDDSDNHDVAFRFKDIQDDFPGMVNFDLSNPETPVITAPQSLLDAIYDPTNYDLDAFEREFTTNEDTEFAARFDVSKDSLMGDLPVTWKGGVKLRSREKVRDVNLAIYEADLNLADYARDTLISNWRLPNAMPSWPDPDLTRGLRSYFTAADLEEEASFFDSNAEDFEIDEQILAGYGMGTLDFGDATVVAGVRIENTKVDMTGRIVTEDALSADMRDVSNDYTNILPSVNLKYQFNEKLIGRAAYYAAVVRPAFGDMAPAVRFNDDRDEVELGNPDLDPYDADNFDLSLEYYPSGLSVMSVGVFYKDISDAIFPANYDIDEVPASVDLSFLPADVLADIEEVNTFINVGKSELYGVEFNYVQSLSELNEMLDGFLVSANLTLTDSESTLPDGRTVPFLKQSDTVWNIALGYDKGPWDLRVSANYRGDYIDELVEENLDRTTDDRLMVEASAKYRVNDNLQVYLEGKNLTDEPEYYYFGNERRLSQYDEFGTSVVFGARYTY